MILLDVERTEEVPKRKSLKNVSKKKEERKRKIYK